MKIELNIGLDVQGGLNTQLTREYRAFQALLALSPFTPKGERRVTSYEGPEGRVTEHLLFVAFESNNLFDVIRIVYHTSHVLEQDCISLYLPETHEGELVGPASTKWGGFKYDYFVRSDTPAERLAA